MDSIRRKALQEAIARGSSYRLAQEDLGFLAGDELRALRLMLEFQKPEAILQRLDVRSTVVVFGSARIIPPLEAQARLTHIQTRILEKPADPDLKRQLAIAKRQHVYSRYYDEARQFAKIISTRFQKKGRRELLIVTGGGPGIMEAANQGAYEIGAHSIGFNIALPQEQGPNPFISPELAFRFHYFALRKMHFLLRARALVAFPGGYGTLDEVMEVLALVQTGKVGRVPIVLVGCEFWRRVLDFDFLVDEGMITAADADLVSIVETAEEAIDILYSFYQDKMP